jgi:hypothetical protein
MSADDCSTTSTFSALITTNEGSDRSRSFVAIRPAAPAANPAIIITKIFFWVSPFLHQTGQLILFLGAASRTQVLRKEQAGGSPAYPAALAIHSTVLRRAHTLSRPARRG